MLKTCPSTRLIESDAKSLASLAPRYHYRIFIYILIVIVIIVIIIVIIVIIVAIICLLLMMMTIDITGLCSFLGRMPKGQNHAFPKHTLNESLMLNDYDCLRREANI